MQKYVANIKLINYVTIVIRTGSRYEGQNYMTVKLSNKHQSRTVLTLLQWNISDRSPPRFPPFDKLSPHRSWHGLLSSLIYTQIPLCTVYILCVCLCVWGNERGQWKYWVRSLFRYCSLIIQWKIKENLIIRTTILFLIERTVLLIFKMERFVRKLNKGSIYSQECDL